MENRSADPSALEQISFMINRYNQLVSDIQQIEDIQKQKELDLNRLKETMTLEISELKLKLSEIKELVDRTTKLKNNVGREFKQIIKIDTFNRLSRRVDLLNYENKISRDELYRVLNR